MQGISIKEAESYLDIENMQDLYALFQEATKLREQYFGNVISCCAIINARCGNCTENCAFCAQSGHSETGVETYPLKSEEEILKEAETISPHADWFSIVTSGRAVQPSKELDDICKTISKLISEQGLRPCASLGILPKETLLRLKEAGMERYHHNLETAGSFFNQVCTTRTYDDQLNAVIAAKEAGLSVCSGGIFGLGESKAQRVELLDTIRSLDVDSVPINFLVPIPGTKLENQNDLTPFDCLKIVAVARLMMPDKNIRICGGREHNLRDLHSWLFFAGANGIMIGNYLTTSGRSIEDDMQMLKDLALKPEREKH